MTVKTQLTRVELIQGQREIVEHAEAAWERADQSHEAAAWELWMAERSKLNALCKYAKSEVSVG